MKKTQKYVGCPTRWSWNYALLKGLTINTSSSGDFMHVDRVGRRFYVVNLPLNVKEAELRDFFNAVMVAAQVQGTLCAVFFFLH